MKLLRGTVYAQAATGLGFGVGLQVAGLMLFSLLGLVLRRGSPAAPTRS